MTSGKPAATSTRGVLIAGAAIVALGLAGFFLLYWNHFVGYRAGGGQFIAWSWMINQGFLPYKDFYYPAPIFYPLRGAVLLSLFGNHFIATRACGLVERCLLGVLVYLFLTRLFSKKVAVLPALTTVVMGSSDCADPLDVYTQEALLFSVMSIIASTQAYYNKLSSKATILLAVLSGLFAGLSFFTKQTIGAGSFAAAAAVGTMSLWRLDGLKRARLFFLSYLGGFFLCSAAFCGWLAAQGILPAFIVQAFISGPASKAGSPWEFVQRFIDKHFAAAMFFNSALVALAIFGKKLLSPVAEETSDSPSENESLKDLLPSALIAASAIASGGYLGYHWSDDAHSQLTTMATTVALAGGAIRIVAMFFTYYGLLMLCLRYLYKVGTSTITRWEAQAFIFAAAAFADATMVCLSFPFYEAVLTPGLAILLALLLNKLRGFKLGIFYAFSFFAISGAVAWKLHLPYFFEDFSESPASEAHQPMQTEEMAGFVLPADMANFLDETTKIVKENSKPGDCIYVYPEGSLFYPLTGRRCPTFSMSHNMDTTTNALAEKDAQIILAHPPKVLIYYQSSEATMRTLEQRWRNGKPSGNRKIDSACQELAQRYRLVKQFPFPKACGDGGIVVNVYVRPD